MKHGWVWAGIVVVGVAACGGDEDEPGDVTGAAGQGTAGQSTAGEGGAGVGGDGPAVVAVAGDAGMGGVFPCENGLQQLRMVEDIDGLPSPSYEAAERMALVAWPEAQRVAVNMHDAVLIFDVSAATSQGSVRLVQQLTADEAGLAPAGGFLDLFRDGEGLIALAWTVEGGQRFLSWQPESGFRDLIGLPEDVAYLTGQLADHDHGIVAGTTGALYRAQPVAGKWSWAQLGSVAERRLKPLAFDGDELLIGVEEIGRLESGLGGAGGDSGVGGAAGAPSAGAGGVSVEGELLSRRAHVERWTLEGERLASHETLGDPRVAIPARGGWLIGETNSFWGSYRAALEWLEPGGSLQQLVEVPVRSSGDGTDGAFDLVMHGQDVLVANCESGLLRGPWDSDTAELSAVPGPWAPEGLDFECNPTALELVGDVMVVAGATLDFVRLCE